MACTFKTFLSLCSILLTPAEVRPIDFQDKRKFEKFKPYLTADEQFEWNQWFDFMAYLSEQLIKPLGISYVCFNSLFPIASLTSQVALS